MNIYQRLHVLKTETVVSQLYVKFVDDDINGNLFGESLFLDLENTEQRT